MDSFDLYDSHIRYWCRYYRLPFRFIKAFIWACSNGKPEFRHQTEVTQVVGIFPVPQNEAADWGVVPGDLCKPDHSIKAGCARFRALYDEMFMFQPQHRFLATADRYVQFWDNSHDYRKKYQNNLKKINEY